METSVQKDQERFTAKARYEKLRTEREVYLQRAREASLLTIPAIMPPEGHSSATKLYTPFQSVGADGVNSLSNKLLLAMLPPGLSFFRLTMDDYVVEELTRRAGGGKEGEDARAEFEVALGKIERAVMNRLEQTGARVVFVEALKHLLVAGNVLVQIMKGSKMRLHYLDHYVVKRDPSGNVLEIVVHERIAKGALPDAARSIAEAPPIEGEQADIHEQSTVDVYTWVKRVRGMFRVHQEIRNQVVPGTNGSYPLDKSDWIPLRYSRIDGEDYGRGRVEEYIGDLSSLESLSQSLVEGSAIAAKHLFLMRPGGTTSKREVTSARNGAVIDGDANDISSLRVDKANDLSVAKSTHDILETRLKQAFLIAQQREAERVTAEEVRAVINELEKTLGGVHAIQAQEFQLPVATRVMHQMEQENKLPRLPKDAIKPVVVTGVDALGRNSEYEKLRAFVADIGAELGPQAVSEWLNVGDYLKRKATALQLDTGLIRSKEEVEAQRAQQQQMAMAAKLGGPMMQAAAKGGEQPAPEPAQ